MYKVSSNVLMICVKTHIITKHWRKPYTFVVSQFYSILINFSQDFMLSTAAEGGGFFNLHGPPTVVSKGV